MAAALHHTSEGAGPPVVLLHPVGLDTTCWDGVAGLLAARRRVIRVDLRGHGLSPYPDPATSVSVHAADVAALMQRLDLPPCPVIGVSFGGMIATALAIEHPARVSTIVISACPSSIPDPARDSLRGRGDAAIAGGMAGILDETLARWFSKPFLAGPEVETYRRRLLADDPQVWRDSWHAIAALNLGPRLGEIAVPVYCIHAEKDLGASLEAMQATARGVPDGRLDIIEGAPHMVHIEHPQEFAALASAHLDRVG